MNEDKLTRSNLSLSQVCFVVYLGLRPRCWLCDGPVALVTWAFTNGPQVLQAFQLSLWIHLNNRTPVRGLFFSIRPPPGGRRWGWASSGMFGSLVSDRLVHDQSAVERKSWRSKVNSWLTTVNFGQWKKRVGGWPPAADYVFEKLSLKSDIICGTAPVCSVVIHPLYFWNGFCVFIPLTYIFSESSLL